MIIPKNQTFLHRIWGLGLQSDDDLVLDAHAAMEAEPGVPGHGCWESCGKPRENHEKTWKRWKHLENMGTEKIEVNFLKMARIFL